jgi:hypothetical protein
VDKKHMAKKMPTVIISHGFLENACLCDDYAILLAKLGYAAVTFDFCGGGWFCKSDGGSENMTLFTELDDLMTVINYIRGFEIVDGDDISLMGCDQGGVVSAIVAKRLGDEIKNLILLSPSFQIPDGARQGDFIVYRFNPFDIPNRIGNFPMKLGGDYARSVMDMDIYEEISGYNGRVLLMHGTKDDVVYISYARRARVLYSNIHYVEIEGANHFYKTKDEKVVYKELTDFMKR